MTKTTDPTPADLTEHKPSEVWLDQVSECLLDNGFHPDLINKLLDGYAAATGSASPRCSAAFLAALLNPSFVWRLSVSSSSRRAELLEALKDAETWIANVVGMNAEANSLRNLFLDEARAAIARAEGKPTLQ